MPLHLHWAAPFQSEQHEQCFRQLQDAASRRLDQLAGAVCCFLSYLAWFRYRHLLHSWQLLTAVLASTLYLLPLAWCQLLRRPDSYTRYRFWTMLALRLNASLLPGIDWNTRKRGLAPPSFPTTITGWIAGLVFVLKLPKLLLTSLAFRYGCPEIDCLLAATSASLDQSVLTDQKAGPPACFTC
jgi:hypothetical protein